MRNLILLIAAIGIMASCVTRERCSEKYPPEVSQNTSITHDTIEKVREKMVYVPADSSWFKALIKCDSLGNAFIAEIIDLRTGKNMTINAGIKDNVITVTAKVDSLAVYLHWKETHIKTTETSERVEKQPEIKARSPSKFENFLYVLKWIWNVWCWLFFVGWIAWKYISRKMTF